MSRVANRVYEKLAPFAIQDSENGFALRKLTTGLAKMFDPIDEIASDQENGTIGYAILFQPFTIARKWLTWVAQFVGTNLTKAPDEQHEREWIAHPLGWERCGPSALRKAIQATLTGSKTVFITPGSLGEPFNLLVTTYESETPNTKATEEAALEQTPAWDVLTLRVVKGGTYAILAASHATYELMSKAHASYQNIREEPSK